MSKISVLFLIDELDAWRGTETHLFRLLQSVDRQRIKPLVAVVGKSGLAQEFVNKNIPVVELAFYKVISFAGVKGLVAICQLIYNYKIDLVVTYHTVSDLLGPIASTLCRVCTLSSRRDEGFTKKPIHVKLQRYINRLTDGMVSVSEAVADTVERQENFPKSKNQIIWNGEDVNLFSSGDSDIREKLNIGERVPLLACVAGLSPVKDHHTLILSFKKILQCYPEAVLLLVGDGSLRDILAEEVASLSGAVKLLGHRSDIPDILRAVDIYVQTSLTEGFSNAILQAMACGLPVVVTSVGGNVELVDNECGYLVEPGDVEMLTNKIVNLINDKKLRAQLGSAGRLRAVKYGSLDVMTESYTRAFERAVVSRQK